jgi:hypothetical protein
MGRPEPETARLIRPLRVVLLAGLVAGFALVTVGVVAALAGAQVSSTCPLPGDFMRCLRGGDFSAPIALGLLVLLVTPPAAAVALGAGFLRARQPGWAAVCALVVGVTLAAILVHFK